MKLTLELTVSDALEILNGLDIDEVAITTTDVPVVEPEIIEEPIITKQLQTAPVDTPELIYQPAKGKRRNHLDMAKGERELELGRRLTPEEEGEVEANFELAKEKVQKAKEKTKKQDHIAEVAAKITEEVEKEEEVGSTIPDTAELPTVSNLFNN